MGRRIEVHMVDAFTKTVNKGNRAGVVFDADGLTSEEMQRIASFANVSETAFVVGSKDKASHDVEVRYFTPTSEVPICGHATIATHFLRAKKYDLGERRVLAKTGIGVLPVDIVRQNGETKVIMTQGTPEMGAVLSQPQKERLLKALGITEDDLAENLPVQVSSTGHSKVMIPLRDQETVHKISPDQEALKQLSHEIDSDGFYIFSIERHEHPYKTHGRMFAPAIGIAEDPVTGNANGPAGLYLAHHGLLDFDESLSYQAIQGEAMGKPGVVEVMLKKDKGAVSLVQVAGTAVEAQTLTYEL